MSWSFLDLTGLSRFFGKLPEKLVTTDTTQTISGAKSFSSTILGSVSGSAASAAKDGAGNVIVDTYETKADAATHLSKSDAAGTYLSKTDAASAYVQTGAVDQTVAGTKTFSKPIAGSVTGSSGSCTGNAATATTATTAKSCTGNAATATKLATARSLWGNNFDGSAAITGVITGTPGIELMPAATTANNGGVLDFHYNRSTADRTSRIIESASGTLSINDVTITTGKVVTATTFNGALKGDVTGNCSGSSGSCTGNAATATKLQTARTINGTSFNGTANITTANWGTARDITIADSTGDNTGEAVSVNGSAAVTLKLPATIKASLDGNAATATSATTAASATTATNATNAAKLGNIASSGYVQTGKVNQTIDGTKTFSAAIVGSVTGNAGSATKLATARTINGTAFNGTADITTANWGTARNISITDGTNTSTAVSVNGSANVSLNLPSTIKATFVGNVTGNVTGNCSGSSGSCTGNAASATKLATARTIALSGAATGTATGFDGSGNITIPVTSLSGSAITSAVTIYDLVPDGAANHRNFYRGKDITAAFNAGTVSANIANGTFRDIFPGDYITKQITVPQILKADGTTEYIAQTTYTVKFIIADLDVWLSRGDTATTAHHVAIMPERVVFNSCMNETNVTDGGYLGSFMNTHVMPAFATGLQNAFGEDHILQFRFLDTKAVNNDLKSGGVVNYTGATYWGGHEWTSHYCHLMLETMVYGAPITASCAADEIMGGVQFAAFRLNSNLVYNRQNYWLSDVVSSAVFARVHGNGHARPNDASSSSGVRPFALLR